MLSLTKWVILEKTKKKVMQLNNLSNLTPLVFITIFLAPLLVLVSLVIGLASFGASFGLRKMYVKALLKIFEVSVRFARNDLFWRCF